MRNQSIDIVKGVCILLMILGHCQGCPWIFCRAIESFHMPAFFIAGGLFFRHKSIDQVCTVGLKRLIIPLLIGVGICCCIMYLLGRNAWAISWLKALLYPGGTRGDDIIAPNWPCIGVFWFLAALFWCRIIYATIDKYVFNYKFWVCALLSWFGIVLAKRLVLPFGVTEGLSGLVFYAFGDFVKSKNLINKSVPWYMHVAFITLWLINILKIQHFQMFQCNYVWYLWPLGVCFACGMSKVIYDLSKHICKYKIGKFLAALGLYSLEFMCCHQIMRTIMDCFRQQVNAMSHPILFASVTLFSGTIILTITYILIRSAVQYRWVKE